MIKRLEDWLLALLQRRCDHPDVMVASDVLEGGGYTLDRCGLSMPYCRRCGAFKLFIAGEHRVSWRKPDPNLWRG